MKSKTYGYGIIDKNNKPWLSIQGIDDNKASINEVCLDLNVHNASNPDPNTPYQVVKLYFKMKE